MPAHHMRLVSATMFERYYNCATVVTQPSVHGAVEAGPRTSLLPSFGSSHGAVEAGLKTRLTKLHLVAGHWPAVARGSPEKLAAAYRPLNWRWVPNPTPRSPACASFFQLRVRGQPRAPCRRERNAFITLTSNSSAAGRQSLVLAGPHPRSRCSSASLVAAAAGASSARGKFFRAPRPGLRRDIRLFKCRRN